jgi:hypothetical protein
MRNTLTTISCLLAIVTLAACSGGHEHGNDADHSHASDHSEADHSHEADTHSHEDAPATEALYGDDAALPGDVDESVELEPVEAETSEADSEEHTHGDSDEHHTHD